jgi:RimJ/RimL family protein N-acetyltransferase
VLEGSLVRLEPLTSDHFSGLVDWALEPALWTLTQKRLDSPDALSAWLADALRARDSGREVPFVVTERASGRAIGSTRYQNIDAPNRRLEIGWSWVGLPWHGGGVNTEMKYLMLRHAFDELAFTRVEFKTNGDNARSRRALRKLGATEEGVFRKSRVDQAGESRDTAWYGII